ncbi:MAG: glycosyltransferase [Bacteroidales bacterium]|nr:glycosyltransferase [Bacteroidales bacterium]
MNKRKKIKVVAVFSNIDYAKEFYWYAKFIDKNLFNVVFIFINPNKFPIEEQIERLGYKVIHYSYKKKLHLLVVTIRLFLFILKTRPHIIHSQLFEATLVSSIAAFFAFTKNRIITRHHSDYHKIYFPSAVKYDKLINLLSRKIIVPSTSVVKQLMLENCKETKIEVIYHGFDFGEFNRTQEQIERIKEKYNLTSKPVIGIISRFTHWKGLQYSIPAFEKLLDFYPHAILVLANAHGEYKSNILSLLKSIPAKNYRVIEFEEDNYSLFKTFDVFVHTPISPTAESFGQVYVEALYLQVPSVFTLSGIACELEMFKKYSIVVDYQNSSQILEALLKILTNYEFYKNQLINVRNEIENYFSFNIKIKKIENLYLHLCKKI